MTLLVMAPAVAAKPLASFAVDVAGFEGGGTLEAVGAQPVVRIKNEADGAPATLFELQAEAIAWRTEYVHAGYTVAATSPQSTPGNLTGGPVSDVSLAHDQVGRFRLMLLSPGADAQVTLSDGDPHWTVQPGRELRERGRGLSVGTDLVANVAAGLQPTDGRSVSLLVTGDFTLLLYDWDVSLRHADGVEAIRTGFENKPMANVTPPAAIGPVRLVDSETWTNQTYLFVQEGRLEIVQSQPDLEVWAEWGLARIEPDLLLVDALGRLPTADGVLELDGDDLALAGSFELEFGKGSPLRAPVRVDGDLDQATLAGKQVNLQGPGGSSWGLWLTAAAVVVPAAAGGVLVNRRRQDRAMAGLELDLELGDYEAVVAAASRVGRARRHRADAAVAKASALLAAGRPEEARTFLDGPEWAGQPAVRCILLAQAHAALGEPKKARACLDEALRLAPMLAAQVEANPDLAAIAPTRAAVADSGSGYQ